MKQTGLQVRLEQLIFSYRIPILVISAFVTLFLGVYAAQIKPEASFQRMLPVQHPFILNFLKHSRQLKEMGNNVHLAVESRDGTIFSADFLQTLQNIHDEVFYIPGIDRGGIKSLWSPDVRWTEVTENGFDGGQVIPDTYDGSPESIEQVRINLLKSGQVGKLVANNLKSSIVTAPLLDTDPQTGKPLDYKALSDQLESIRRKYAEQGTSIRITGFAKVVGDMIEGAARTASFFGIALILLLIFLYLSARCFRSVVIRAVPALMAVIWYMGILKLLGYGLNPYSMLVPFLIFSLAVSHSMQMGNALSHAMLNGESSEMAARQAFQRVFIPGLAALISDALGFVALFTIRIGVIRDIAAGVCIGVAVIIYTNLILLPILMSYVSSPPQRRKKTPEHHPVWKTLCSTIHPRPARIILSLAILIFGGGLYARRNLQIGDLDRGAPELHPDSRYNLDNAFMGANYSVSSDIFIIMLETPPKMDSNYQVVVATDRLQWKLQQLEGVQSVVSYIDVLKQLNSAFNEGHPKWAALPRNKISLDFLSTKIPGGLVNPAGTLAPIIVYLKDHKAQTLKEVTAAAESFAAENNSERCTFALAAGNAGIEAAVNIEIEKAMRRMTPLIFAAVALVCLITYRSLRATVCIVLPLYLTSALCEALMAQLGIGVKVATLPVIAVGVGVGVDYGIYIYGSLHKHLQQGRPLQEAYFKTLTTTGHAVLFTGATLAIAVGTWIFSPIKFQTDMGFLLTFMFIVNMIGALCLLPVLVHFTRIPSSSSSPRKPD